LAQQQTVHPTSPEIRKMSSCCRTLTLCSVALVLTLPSAQTVADTFYGPLPYLSAADIPAGFYAGGTPSGLENFEDGNLGFGILASGGNVFGPGGLTDSVDGDDGTLDGSGTNGRSWFFSAGATGVTFTFAGTLPTAAGIVWTDGAGLVTFEAFGPGMTSLGSVSASIAGSAFSGQTDEDRFFGIQSSGGILALKLRNASGGIEVDHVQFGEAAAVPEPSCGLLLCTSLVLLAARWGRWRRAS
jgi:hypothetical protein